MHHHRSKGTLRSLKLGACHFIFNIALAMATACFFVYGIWMFSQQWIYVGVGSLVLCLVSMGVFFAKSRSVCCPLCRMPVLSGGKCSKHRKARPALGVSYRLRVVLSALFLGYYFCIYCGEPFDTKKSRNQIC